MKCVECGREFEAGDRPDGLPNGVGFQLEDGSVICCCTDCIIEKGKQSNLTKGREDPDEHMG